MLAIKGYYDGEHIVPEDNLKLNKNQKVILTVLDEEKKDSNVDLSKYIGRGRGIWNCDAQKHVKELRENDRY